MSSHRRIGLASALLFWCATSMGQESGPVTLREALLDPSTREHPIPVTITLASALPAGVSAGDLRVRSLEPYDLESFEFPDETALERGAGPEARWKGRLPAGAYAGRLELNAADGLSPGPDFGFSLVVEGKRVEHRLELPRVILLSDLDVPSDAEWVPYTHEPVAPQPFSFGSDVADPRPAWLFEGPGHWSAPGVPIRTCLPRDPFPDERVPSLTFDVRLPEIVGEEGTESRNVQVFSVDRRVQYSFAEPPYVIASYPPDVDWAIWRPGYDVARVTTEAVRAGETIRLVPAKPRVDFESATPLEGLELRIEDLRSGILTEWRWNGRASVRGAPLDLVGFLRFEPTGSNAPDGIEWIGSVDSVSFRKPPVRLDHSAWTSVEIGVEGLPELSESCALSLIDANGNHWSIRGKVEGEGGHAVAKFSRVPPGRGYAVVHGTAAALIPVTVESEPLERNADITTYSLIVPTSQTWADGDFVSYSVSDDRFDHEDLVGPPCGGGVVCFGFGEPIFLPRGTVRLFGSYRYPGVSAPCGRSSAPITVEVGRETRFVQVPVPVVPTGE